MKLQVRFMLLLITVFGGLAGLLLVQRDFDVQRSQQVLSSELSQRKKLFATNLTSEGTSLQTLSEDYSFWDDMVNFVKTGDVQFAHVNLDSGLSTFEADADWVYRPDGTLVYSSAADNGKVPPLKLPKNFFSQLTINKFAHYYTQLPAGTFEVRAATIVPGTDAAHKSAPSGYWIVGRYLTSDFLNHMSSLSQSTVKFVPAGATMNDQANGNSVGFTIPLKDIDGTTVRELNSTSRVALIDQLNSLYRQEIMLLSEIGIVLFGVILITVWLLVLRPLSTISRSIQKQRPDMLNKLTRSSSQFGDLAKIVQQFFTQKVTIEEDAFKKAELERLNKDKTAFLAVAAHELKAPGGIIKLVAEDLPKTAHTLTPEELADQLEIITHQATKMTNMVADLRLASEGKDSTTLHNAAFDFDTFLSKELVELGYVINQKIILTGSTGQVLNADADRLGQVVSNLIRNAAKYSPDADTITVRSSFADGTVTVEVEDFGVGISAEDQAHIFDRFYRSPSVAQTFQGLGLGLSICKTIIDRMGGKIWVESELGKGTHMYFSLAVSNNAPPNIEQTSTPAGS